MLNQTVQKALDSDTDHWVTLLGVCKDSASVIALNSSYASDYTLRPRLDLSFSDSRTLLYWAGRDNALVLPVDSTITLAGSPSIGDGRYGRVVRFHEEGQYAAISDAQIDYSQGSVSFWYQKSLSGGDAADAVLLYRDVDAGSDEQFMLFRQGTENGMRFWYGDTTGDSTGTNEMVWAFTDTFINIDTVIAGDTAWDTTYDDLMQPFDGGQHFFRFAWNRENGSFSLSIDGTSPVTNRSFLTVANASTWAADSR